MKSVSRILLTILTWLLCANSSLSTNVHGPVSGIWTPAGNPYNVVGQLTLPAGQTLVIQPGVQVIFQGRYKFLVYGMLQAVGTVEDSILFTAANLTTGWWGLRFYNLNTQPDSSRLLYCRITYGVSSSDNSAGDDKRGGAIFASNSSKLLISHCLIAYNRTGDVWGANGQNGQPGYNHPGEPGGSVSSGNGGAVYLTVSNSIISDNKILFNHTGNATGGQGGSGGDCLMLYGGDSQGGNGGAGGNAETGSGGAIYCQFSCPTLLNNILQDNSTGSGFGGAGGHGGNASNAMEHSAYGGDGGNGGWGKAGSGSCPTTDNNSLKISLRSRV